MPRSNPRTSGFRFITNKWGSPVETEVSILEDRFDEIEEAVEDLQALKTKSVLYTDEIRGMLTLRDLTAEDLLEWAKNAQKDVSRLREKVVDERNVIFNAVDSLDRLRDHIDHLVMAVEDFQQKTE